MEEPPHVLAVLIQNRPVEAEAVLHERDRLGCRLPPRDQARDVVRGDEEHAEDDRCHHPEDDCSEGDAADGEGEHHYRLKRRSPRGSSASRTLSPSRLNASVVRRSAAAGKKTYHQATW